MLPLSQMGYHGDTISFKKNAPTFVMIGIDCEIGLVVWLFLKANQRGLKGDLFFSVWTLRIKKKKQLSHMV